MIVAQTSNDRETIMDQELIQQILDELLSSFEPLEAQGAALLQFLKAKGLATDEELAPFHEQAGNTANVRWRAVRVRTAALIANAMKPADQPKPATPKNAETTSQPASGASNAESEEKTEAGNSQKEPKSKEGKKAEGDEGDKKETAEDPANRHVSKSQDASNPQDAKEPAGEQTHGTGKQSGEQPENKGKAA